jgi:PLP dependent protein
MIQENIRAIKTEIGGAKLIIVSKYRSQKEMEEVYDCGERMFAENRVQELVVKHGQLPKDVEWHLIGHLQTNKVKQILPLISTIHSVDSIKLLNTIEKEAKKLDLIIDVLLQVHVSTDETKHGFKPDALIDLCNEQAFSLYENIRFIGIMTMSTLNAEESQISNEFLQTHQLMLQLKPLMPRPDIFTEISMGMSGDYKLAVREGSTIIRIGSAIFA